MGICISKDERKLRNTRVMRTPKPPCCGKVVNFLVTRVIDGDTFMGHYMTEEGSPIYTYIRTAGIDAPEMSTDAGKMLKGLLEVFILDKVIPIRILKWGTYTGRTIADVEYARKFLDMGVVKPYNGKNVKPIWTYQDLKNVKDILNTL